MNTHNTNQNQPSEHADAVMCLLPRQLATQLNNMPDRHTFMARALQEAIEQQEVPAAYTHREQS